MKRRNKAVIIVLVIGILASIGIITLLSKTNAISGMQFAKFVNMSDNKSPKGKKIVDKIMTWGECLKLYSETYFHSSPNGNPRPDISDDHKVRVIITEYPNGVECKNGFYNYGVTCNIFDAKTKEVLNSVGFYKDKKNK
jgi:hypothetical protein